MPRRSTLALSLTIVAAGAPAAAQAASLTAPGACLPNNEILPWVGSGFTPQSTVKLTGMELDRSAFPDATGAFQTTLLTPNNTTYTPRTYTVTATNEANPAETASVAVQVVKFGVSAPLNGKPSDTAVWRFAGFTAGKPLYGHFRYHGQTIRNYRFGTAKGACGTLKTRAKRLPARSRRGTWTLQVDQAKSYSAKTRPSFRTSFTIYRTFS